MAWGAAWGVNGPINNGASASLHSVSISESFSSRLPVVEINAARRIKSTECSKGEKNTYYSKIKAQRWFFQYSVCRRNKGFKVKGKTGLLVFKLRHWLWLWTRSWRDGDGLKAQSITFQLCAFGVQLSKSRGLCCPLTVTFGRKLVKSCKCCHDFMITKTGCVCSLQCEHISEPKLE